MKKFKPCITIWVVDIYDKNSYALLGQEFFLFYNRAKKMYEKKLKEYENEDCHISFGGEPLWLW